MKTQSTLQTPFVVAYGKGGLDIHRYSPERDSLIVMTDPKDPVPSIVARPGALPVLHLEVSDINDEHLSWAWRFIANHSKSEKSVSYVSNQLSKDWPTIPFTPNHAATIIEFAESIGFSRNIHVCCSYGRSRSVTVAKFLAEYLFPGFDLRVSRTDARINPRIYRLLKKTYLRS